MVLQQFIVFLDLKISLKCSLGIFIDQTYDQLCSFKKLLLEIPNIISKLNGKLK